MTSAGAVLVVVLAYLLGAVPFGLVLTRLKTGVDVRRVGSGNIGASNAARVAGKGVGVLTLLLDAAKAALPMLLAREVLFTPGGPLAGAFGLSAEGWSVVVGLAAFAGHLFPVWLGGKGGKGVATALGVFLVLAPVPALLALVVFGVAYGLTRITAVGSLLGTAVCCGGAFVQELLVRGRGAADTAVPWAGLLVAALIFLRHRANIGRLVRGTENRV